MKSILGTTFLALFLSLQAIGQVTVGLRVGYSPTVRPGTNYLIANRHDPGNEFIFDAEKVTYSPQAGLVVRSESKHFWFMGEALFSQGTTTYSIRPIDQTFPKLDPGPQMQTLATDPTMYKEKVNFVDLPLSAGVKIGKFEVFSGFHATFELMRESQLESRPEITRAMTPTKLGWHSGIGFNFNRILFDVRYQQQFSNYGQGLFAGGQELILKNAPGRFTASVAFRF